ncbi:MAG TPA: ribosome maturation factor RimM [Nevskiaceae bacterium]|nr:ribosome maturation factor RimM [Nevskiaceae bacterium]
MGRLTLGRVAGVFGVRGWIKVLSHTRPIDNLLDYSPWWIAGREGFEAKLIEGRVHGRGLVARITGPTGEPIDDRDVAAALIGADIEVDRARLPEPPAGEYYWADLEGLAVRNMEGVTLGVVDGLTSNGAQDVLVVKQDRVQRLIPFVQGPIVKSVDLPGRSIVVDWQPDY